MQVAAGSRGAFNTISATASKAGDNIKQQVCVPLLYTHTHAHNAISFLTPQVHFVVWLVCVVTLCLQLEALDQRTHIISRIKNVGLGGGAAQGSQDGTGPHTGAETGPDASGSSISASMTAGL